MSRARETRRYTVDFCETEPPRDSNGEHIHDAALFVEFEFATEAKARRFARAAAARSFYGVAMLAAWEQITLAEYLRSDDYTASDDSGYWCRVGEAEEVLADA